MFLQGSNKELLDNFLKNDPYIVNNLVVDYKIEEIIQNTHLDFEEITKIYDYK